MIKFYSQIFFLQLFLKVVKLMSLSLNIRNSLMVSNLVIQTVVQKYRLIMRNFAMNRFSTVR
jgi:hypothetical protein